MEQPNLRYITNLQVYQSSVEKIGASAGQDFSESTDSIRNGLWFAGTQQGRWTSSDPSQLLRHFIMQEERKMYKINLDSASRIAPSLGKFFVKFTMMVFCHVTQTK